LKAAGAVAPVGPHTKGPEPLQAGRVGRAHGLDGSFYVTGAQPRLLALGVKVTIAGAARAIVRRAGIDKRPILRLEGIEDRSTVESLRGVPLTVPRQDAPTLPEGEWWAHELEGCTVLDGERDVGTVAGLLELPSCEALRVHREDGSELLVPMVSNAIRRIDVSRGRIDIDLGFLGEAKPESEQGLRTEPEREPESEQGLTIEAEQEPESEI
jgi:16S rRNA processing protein RimM